jgi:hypothetical protein
MARFVRTSRPVGLQRHLAHAGGAFAVCQVDHVPAIHTDSVERFSDSCLSTVVSHHLQGLSPIEMRTMDEWIASLACGYDKSILQISCFGCFRLLLTLTIPRARVYIVPPGQFAVELKVHIT